MNEGGDPADDTPDGDEPAGPEPSDTGPNSAEPNSAEPSTAEPSSAEPAGDVSEDVAGVLAALALIRELTVQVMGAATWQLTNEQSVAAVEQACRAFRQAQAAYLRLVAELDSRTGTVKGAPAGYEARIFIRTQLNRTQTQAKADIAAAHALQPGADPAQRGLPRLGAAFAAGEVSREHVDAAVRMIGTAPTDVLGLPTLDEDGNPLLGPDGAPALAPDGRPLVAGDVIDEKITQHAKEYNPAALAGLAKELGDVLDPDGSRSYNPDACMKRRLTLRQDYAGMWNLRADLPPADGALLNALIEHLCKPASGEVEDGDGKSIPIIDQRSATQRRTDALITITQQAARSAKLGRRGGEPPRITIITRVEDLAAARASQDGETGGDGGFLGTGEHINAGLLAQLSCDALLQRALLAPSGAVLDLGREVRTVTPAQRRALTARDRGCVIPGCTAPAYMCEGHHVRWWTQNGDTDIGNLALVCTTHHTQIHTGAWTLVMHDGIPWAQPPDWLWTSNHNLIRNTYHHDVQELRDYGTQLRLQLDETKQEPPDEPKAA